jgi:hypothetical protein
VAFRRLLCLALLLASALYALSTFAGIANFAWRQPLLDQYRLYEYYLTLPFPANILQIENGHRPIVPALLRVAEIRWAQADQHWQIAVGAVLVALTALIIGLSCLRNRRWSPVARCSGVLFTALAVLWLANARMLLHGNELVHTYLVTTCVATAAWAVWLAQYRHRLALVVACALLCTVATFSFGPGIASFMAVGILAIALRLPARDLWPLPAALALSLLAYLYLLPGDAALEGTLRVDPLRSLWVAMQWLGSPWVTAWLGLGDPPLEPSMAASAVATPPGAALQSTATLLVRTLGSEGRYALAGLFSTAGVTAVAAALFRLWRRGAPCDHTKAIALGLCLFGLGTSCVVGIARLDYLLANPGQRFADRYLVWPCLFWLGLALLGLSWLAARPRREAGMALGALLLSVLLLPMHRAGIGWGSAVYRSAQRFAAAVQSDVVDEAVYPSDLAVARSSVTHVLALFRERRLAMFAPPLADEMGKQWPVGAPVTESTVAFGGIELRGQGASSYAHFSGWVERGVRALAHADALVVIDASGRVVGYAQFSYIGPQRGALRLDIPLKRGFDGYVRDYEPGARYTLAQLDAANHRARPILRLPAPPALPSSTAK